MRVLVIDEALPVPADSGKRIRTFELLRRLAPAFDVSLAYHEEGEADVEARAEAEAAGIRCIPVRRRPLTKRGVRFAWDLARNLALPVPYMVMAHRTRVLRAAVAEEIRTRRPDLVHVEWTPLLANLELSDAPPVCVSAHNIESDIWRRYRENETRCLRRAYIGAQHRKVARYERAAFAAAAGVTAVSEGDAARVRAWAPQTPVVVVPNGVDAARFVPDEAAAPQADTVLFVGALDWRPNLDAVTWYLDEIHPHLRQARPQAVFEVVGRNPPTWLHERVAREPGVRLHPDVPDVRPYLARAAICVVPLRIGGGSRLKICEALAAGRPVVSTSVGAEGLEVGDGIVRRDDAAAFARAIAEALADPDAAQMRAQRGRADVLAHHTWDTIAPRQAAFWTRLGGRDA